MLGIIAEVSAWVCIFVLLIRVGILEKRIETIESWEFFMEIAKVWKHVQEKEGENNENNTNNSNAN